MTRIVSGFAGSLGLAVPKSGTRPTSDRVREAMFSSLESMDAISGIRVLDLYAGSGALALEAVSRGASSAVLVEQNAQAASVCRRNASAVLKAATQARSADGAGSGLARVDVRQSTVRGYLAQSGGADFGLAFLDPPYDVTEAELADVLAALVAHLREDAVVVVERSARSPEPRWPAPLDPFRTKAYGETAVWFAGLAASDSADASPDAPGDVPPHPQPAA
jgi:16S rRNA (guanine966-N2)-methyltransferase